MGIREAVVAQSAGPHGPLGWVTAWIMPMFHDAYCGDLAAALALQSEEDLLEVACGAGVFLQKRARHVRHVAGIDHSEIQVRMARRRLRDRLAAGTAEVVRGDAAALPWGDAAFDAAACNCLGCLARPERALHEIHRVVRPGGRVAFSIEHCPDDAAARRVERQWGLPAWTDEAFCALLYEVGFRDIAFSHVRTMTFVRAARP